MFKLISRAAGVALLCALSLAAFLLLKPVPISVDPIQPRGDTRYWLMAGGYRIAYTRIAAPGGATRPPVIFLHGGPGGYIHSEIIRTLAPLAADGRDIYLYDQSGTGLSDRRDRPKDTTIATHLEDLEAIRARIGADRMVLIGHSFGGLLAALYAADHPDHIERLVLSAPGGLEPALFDADGTPTTSRLYPTPANLKFEEPEGYVEATEAGNMPVRAQAAFLAAAMFNVKMIPDLEMDAAVNSMATNFTRTMVCDPAKVKPEEGGAGAYSRVGTNYYPDGFVDRRPAMRRMNAPVLVLQGQCDFLAYDEVYEYAATFPDAGYRFIPGAGHIIWWEQPEPYRAAIQAFLNGESPVSPDRAQTSPPTAPAPARAPSRGR